MHCVLPVCVADPFPADCFLSLAHVVCFVLFWFQNEVRSRSPQAASIQARNADMRNWTPDVIEQQRMARLEVTTKSTNMSVWVGECVCVCDCECEGSLVCVVEVHVRD